MTQPPSAGSLRSFWNNSRVLSLTPGIPPASPGTGIARRARRTSSTLPRSERQFLEKNSGREDKKKEAVTKKLYDDLKLEQRYQEYEEKVVGELRENVSEIDESEALKNEGFPRQREGHPRPSRASASISMVVPSHAGSSLERSTSAASKEGIKRR
ncbi:hypothetical protein V8F20_012311 [Naviculisporaceae sp. PSN 640]